MAMFSLNKPTRRSFFFAPETHAKILNRRKMVKFISLVWEIKIQVQFMRFSMRRWTPQVFLEFIFRNSLTSNPRFARIYLKYKIFTVNRKIDSEFFTISIFYNRQIVWFWLSGLKRVKLIMILSLDFYNFPRKNLVGFKTPIMASKEKWLLNFMLTVEVCR